MIILHTLKGDEYMLNSFHIEKIESKPDTIITLTNERKFIVRESPEEIMSLIVDFQKKIKVSISFDINSAKS